MASSYWGNADFRVIPDDRKMFPVVNRDNDGVPRYKATVKPASETEYKNLMNNVSIVQTRRGRGGYNFVFTIDAGPTNPVRTLEVPIRAGNRGQFDAILVSCTATTYGRTTLDSDEFPSGHYFECECEWIITSDDITPDAILSPQAFFGDIMSSWGFDIDGDLSVEPTPSDAPQTEQEFATASLLDWGFDVEDDFSLS